MAWVHQRLFQLTGTHDPLQALARELSQEVRVLCFDELFVNDIGDAIILGRLFQVMFEEGVPRAPSAGFRAKCASRTFR